MEEWVGEIWHKIVMRASTTQFKQAEVTLEQVRQPVAMMFRAMGGNPALKLETTTAWQHGAKRSFWSKIAGSNQTVELAWQDNNSLRLPPKINCFPETGLNRQLYLWLAALTAISTDSNDDWLLLNSKCSALLLHNFPGLAETYQQLVTAHISQRPDINTLSKVGAEYENVIRESLLKPHSVIQSTPKPEKFSPAPVPLWLHPAPPYIQQDTSPGNDGDLTDDQDKKDETKDSKEVKAPDKKQGERVDNPEDKAGLLAFRLESLFSRSEYVAVDRPTEDNEDDNAESSLEDLDRLSMSKDRNSIAARLKFDLDLPAQAYDDLYLGEGLPLPEWNYQTSQLQVDHCRLQTLLARDVEPCQLPKHLKRDARQLRTMFEMIRPQRIWRNSQTDGTEIDITALIQQTTLKRQGKLDTAMNLYRNLETAERNLSCLLLADLSLSTDAHVNDDQRVIDIIRDSLFLFTEALSVSQDQFAIYGFSSRNRDHIRYNQIKSFNESPSDEIRGRIAAIKPGYYTRMGGAIRRSTQLLLEQGSETKLLLILTDGKPNDLDKYEGRYGVEDTRDAVMDAIKQGIQPFCVTIDKEAGSYLPYIFGHKHYMLIKNAKELPLKLPALYGKLIS